MQDSARVLVFRFHGPKVPAAHLMSDLVADCEAVNKRVTVMKAGVHAGAEDFALEIPHVGECMSGAGDSAGYRTRPETWFPSSRTMSTC